MSFTITRVLHAGYIFDSGQTRILFDPLFETPFSVNCYAFPAVTFDLEAIRRERFDAVFISHYHDDHCSFESLVYLDRATPIFIYCIFDELLDLIRELGFTHVTSLTLNEKIMVGDIDVIPRLALDAEVDSAYEIHAAGFQILNVVDSWLDPSTVDRLEERAPWDLVLWPFQTMLELAVLSPSRAEKASREIPQEWLEQIRRLQPRAIVPSSCQFRFESWSWMNHAMFPITYAQFAKEVQSTRPETRVIRLNPGNSICLSSVGFVQSEPLNWVHAIGEQDVDYSFQENQEVPSTSQIAQRLAPISKDSCKKVADFCQNKISERYSALPTLSEGVFSEPRVWRLSVYDHAGEASLFQFRLNGSQMIACDLTIHPEWNTEIPAVKLLAALEEGEALTSLYLRIETRFEDADLVEDPLLRCFYNGAFASYQKAQLERLKRERLL